MLAALILATVINTTSATADTGGNSIGAGGAVVTGNESASATVTNVVGREDGETTITTEVTKEVNGVVTHEVTTTTVPSGEEAIIEVEADASATSATAIPISQSVSEAPGGIISAIVEGVSQILVKIFGFFGFSA